MYPKRRQKAGRSFGWVVKEEPRRRWRREKDAGRPSKGADVFNSSLVCCWFFRLCTAIVVCLVHNIRSSSTCDYKEKHLVHSLLIFRMQQIRFLAFLTSILDKLNSKTNRPQEDLWIVKSAGCSPLVARKQGISPPERRNRLESAPSLRTHVRLEGVSPAFPRIVCKQTGTVVKLSSRQDERRF